MFELGDNSPHNAQIKVIGLGGGGGNAIEHMMAEHIDGVEFVCANTDAQALGRSSARTIIQLGEEITKGLGAGANPEVGRQAAEENRERVREVLEGTDILRNTNTHRHIENRFSQFYTSWHFRGTTCQDDTCCN